jgi:hypothetical protein
MAIPYQERFANEAECIKYDDQRANELERSLRNQVRAEIEPDTEMGKDKYFMVLQKFGLARARLLQTEINQAYKGRPSPSYRDTRYNSSSKGDT